ncbi:NAD-dependent epimerase/dehydratase family protein [Kitasatospora sp. NBC_01302]|uniref:NAD-dependent epimerase/dehydratase family protein n=1 Tax=Kitasatospora sp. NBC_01302 TaxID=2903575 RepID=UPI002E108EAF|nr:NAD-dependent epimerase/dehydratase family protein [Kitasatospora sp. NBC_01302]
MQIVGRGFLAGHLESIASAHPRAVVLAAGVSATSDTSHDDYGREAAVLYDTADRCASRGERLVFFSTASAGMYSVPGRVGKESGPVFPATPYGRHKLALETVLASSTVDYLILRLAHVVGPRQPPHQLLPSLAAQIRAGVVSIQRGAQRDLIDVDDVVRIIDELLSTGVSREVVNVASGVAVPAEQIVDHLEMRLGRTAERRYNDSLRAQAVSVEKLRALAPCVRDMNFGPDYFRAVLDKYVTSFAGTPS